MMTYKAFLQLATELNTNWRGGFNTTELKEMATEYMLAYKANGTKHPVIISLLDGLKEDADNGDEDAVNWMSRF